MFLLHDFIGFCGWDSGMFYLTTSTIDKMNHLTSTPPLKFSTLFCTTLDLVGTITFQIIYVLSTLTATASIAVSLKSSLSQLLAERLLGSNLLFGISKVLVCLGEEILCSWYVYI